MGWTHPTSEPLVIGNQIATQTAARLPERVGRVASDFRARPNSSNSRRRGRIVFPT
jgi:hypothetical protein